MRKTLGFVFLGMFVGYSLACFLFREEYFVDVNSGKVREISTLPPFKITKDRSDRAFPLIFPFSQEIPEKWVKIGSSKKLPIVFFGKKKYTRGDSILAQQRTLISLFLTNDVRLSDRKLISDTYFEKISNGDFAGASEYVSKLWENSASGHSK
jgi:hypothetical protein